MACIAVGRITYPSGMVGVDVVRKICAVTGITVTGCNGNGFAVGGSQGAVTVMADKAGIMNLAVDC